VYSRKVDDQLLSFGVSGKLVMNALVMYDRQTGSLWGQIIGEAIEGPLKGTKLDFIPALHTTWADWKALHPDTLALVKGFSGARSVYDSYFTSGDAGIHGATNPDERLFTKEFVLGVEHNGLAAAYPFRVLSEQPVVNDVLGDLPLLVVFNPEAASGVAFSRLLQDGRTLTFALQGERLVDLETGSTWDPTSGLALEGLLAGTQLQPLKYTMAFWFGWRDWFPETRLYGVE
jgi:hypothetical protein